MNLDHVPQIGHGLRSVSKDLLATILELIDQAWHRVHASGACHRGDSEPVIAGWLRTKMLEVKKAWGLRTLLIIDEAAERSLSQPLIPDGYIDIKCFFDLADEDKYFGVECKRVSDSDSSLIGRYVEEGVARFTDGKYCPHHDVGMLVGFVIGGTPASCSTALAMKCLSCTARISLLQSWSAEPHPPFHLHTYSTTHGPHCRVSSLRLYHRLLNVLAEAPSPI